MSKLNTKIPHELTQDGALKRILGPFGWQKSQFPDIGSFFEE